MSTRTSERAAKAAAEVDDGRLALLDEAGNAVQVIPASVCEHVRAMVHRLRLDEGGDELPQRIGVVSTLAGEGSTTITRALGLVLSHDFGLRVCIVDLNFWSPFEWPNPDEVRSGIAEVLAAGAPADAVMVRTGNPGLSLLPAGASVVGERPLLAKSVDLDRTLEGLAERYDHLLLDLPALRTASDALTLAERAGSLILVVHQGVTSDAEVRDTLEQLNGLTVLGAILNRTSSKIPGIIRRRIPPL